jgi:preprotein translocase subunit SecE
MSAKIEANPGRYDGLKWLLVIFLVALAVVGNYYYSAESVLYRVLAILAIAVVAGFFAISTEKGKQFTGLLSDARIEIRKVVWPNRQEWTQTTIIVVVFVLIVALLLWIIDSLVSWLVSGLIG